MSRVTSRTNASRRIGLRMRALRHSRGWSQVELAERLSANGFAAHPTTVTRMESGSRQIISIDAALAVAATFEVPLDDLISDECLTCKGSPPAGFRCQNCGAE
ncbi:helix-turn-helix transcriptional regulator [Nonomuraea sp. NPDC026600]|uniref:helix-turn-helix transcriptional regulator n=1 Tax=Nonomuraea sp. NPDC026600 TaxID=3155363 RepID=UPI0033DFD19F